jgi:AcrR family transcriptional regulator
MQAGLRVMRARGIDGVTMRAVAAELDTGAASLYVYVSNRRDLLNQMFDLVAGEVDLGDAPDPARWRRQVEDLLFRVLRALESYPGSARVPLGNVPTGPNAVRITERLIELMRAGGVDDRSAAWFVDVIFLFVNATAYETDVYAEAGREQAEVADDVRQAFESLDLASNPNFRSMLPLLTSGDGDERFRFGVRLMIEGLLHVAPPDVGE